MQFCHDVITSLTIPGRLMPPQVFLSINQQTFLMVAFSLGTLMENSAVR